jgi:uncharacterized damage-inducible protein DinB
VSRIEHISLMAEYNEWMNSKLYKAAMDLPGEALMAERQAFFGSLFGTLNHLAVGDTIWLQRFATHPAHFPALDPIRKLPAPTSLDQLLYSDIHSLATYRRSLDHLIRTWAHSLDEAELDLPLRYSNTQGVVAERNFFSLIMHFFNHQTHHRGQASTLLSQANADIGVTDLLALIPNAQEL